MFSGSSAAHCKAATSQPPAAFQNSDAGGREEAPSIHAFAPTTLAAPAPRAAACHISPCAAPASAVQAPSAFDAAPASDAPAITAAAAASKSMCAPGTPSAWQASTCHCLAELVGFADPVTFGQPIRLTVDQSAEMKTSAVGE